ncbi:hypothetical protein [Streptomyces sp. TRM70350]|nr:hypothetical protein [Streptomyces sp. TRM70350]MBV7698066.1 hypothetical protein [Streptomyces sp. TRM70350]
MTASVAPSRGKKASGGSAAATGHSSKVTFGNATAWVPTIDRIELGRVVG